MSPQARVRPVEVGCAPPPRPDTGPESAREMVAELFAAGVDHLVVGDHVSFFGGFGVDGLVHATALSMLHPTMPVYTSVYLLVLRHPVLVARQISTLASLAPGRLVLGVGIGGEDRAEVLACGIDPRTRGRRMDECIAILRSLVDGGSTSFSGEFFDLADVAVRPAPRQPVPIIVGGRSDAAVRRAGRLGDGWLGIWVSPDRFASAARRADEAAEEAGRGTVDWCHAMTVWCGFGDDRREGEAAVAPVMEGLYGLPFERFARYVPRGTPAQVASQLAPYVAAGCRCFNLLAQCRDSSATARAVAEVRAALRGARLPS